MRLVESGKSRTFGKKVLAPKTVNQRRYIDAIENHDLTFGIGPAGTGKTYLAVAMAVSAFLNKRVSRIVLTRPAVEAGEHLGFLPGTLQEKVDPYLRPLYDALFDMIDAEKVEKLIERNTIEIAPLAFMRGRTLNDCFIILDEAQNTTAEQMKMILTRQGFNSKMVVTGDQTQIDLPAGKRSGLLNAAEVLRGVEGIAFVDFNDKDVVRHPLVQRIVKAYDRYNEMIGSGPPACTTAWRGARRKSDSASRDHHDRGNSGISAASLRPVYLKTAMDPGESRTPNISKKQQPLAPEMVFRALPAALRLSAAEKRRTEGICC